MGVLGELRGSNLVVGAIFFCLVVVTIPLNIAGICVMKCKGKCANCCGLFITRSSCAFLFVAMTLVAILGLVLLPISIVFSDVCVLMDTLPQVWGTGGILCVHASVERLFPPNFVAFWTNA